MEQPGVSHHTVLICYLGGGIDMVGAFDTKQDAIAALDSLARRYRDLINSSHLTMTVREVYSPDAFQVPPGWPPG